MKKLLSILTACCLTVSGVSAVVSCDNNNNNPQKPGLIAIQGLKLSNKKLDNNVIKTISDVKSKLIADFLDENKSSVKNATDKDLNVLITHDGISPINDDEWTKLVNGISISISFSASNDSKVLTGTTGMFNLTIDNSLPALSSAKWGIYQNMQIVISLSKPAKEILKTKDITVSLNNDMYNPIEVKLSGTATNSSIVIELTKDLTQNQSLFISSSSTNLFAGKIKLSYMAVVPSIKSLVWTDDYNNKDFNIVLSDTLKTALNAADIMIATDSSFTNLIKGFEIPEKQPADKNLVSISLNSPISNSTSIYVKSPNNKLWWNASLAGSMHKPILKSGSWENPDKKDKVDLTFDTTNWSFSKDLTADSFKIEAEYVGEEPYTFIANSDYSITKVSTGNNNSSQKYIINFLTSKPFEHGYYISLDIFASATSLFNGSLTF